MTNCILVADNGRARLFTVRELEDPEIDGGPEFREDKSWANPEQLVPSTELFDSKRGRHRSPGGAGAHRYDDHREANRAERAARFAKSVAHDVAVFVKENEVPQLVAAVEPQFLGLLRTALRGSLPPNVRVIEFDGNLTSHPPGDVRRVLEQRGLVAERRRPKTGFKSRGQRVQ